MVYLVGTVGRRVVEKNVRSGGKEAMWISLELGYSTVVTRKWTYSVLICDWCRDYQENGKERKRKRKRKKKA